MNRLTARLLAVAALTGIYLLMLASTKPADIAVGALLAIGALAVSQPLLTATAVAPHPRRAPGWRRLLAAPWFAWGVMREMVGGTWHVLVFALGLRPLERPGVIGIRIGPRSPLGVTVSAMVTTLSPGTALVAIDHDHGVFWLHVLDAHDPEAVREAHQRFYERYQRGIFP